MEGCYYYYSEMITVFINGVATEVGRGPLDMKAIFGGDFVVFHSSGVAVEMNEFGFLLQGLQHGESYFLVIFISSMIRSSIANSVYYFSSYENRR